MTRTRQDPPTAYLVTTAAEGPEVDRRSREKRYLILMGIRVIAIVASIIASRVFHLGALVVLLVLAAMILPWIAVVIANAGPSVRTQKLPALFTPGRRRIGGPRP